MESHQVFLLLEQLVRKMGKRLKKCNGSMYNLCHNGITQGNINCPTCNGSGMVII